MCTYVRYFVRRSSTHFKSKDNLHYKLFKKKFYFYLILSFLNKMRCQYPESTNMKSKFIYLRLHSYKVGTFHYEFMNTWTYENLMKFYYYYFEKLRDWNRCLFHLLWHFKVKPFYYIFFRIWYTFVIQFIFKNKIKYNGTSYNDQKLNYKYRWLWKMSKFKTLK